MFTGGGARALWLLFPFALFAQPQAYTISTVAGSLPANNAPGPTVPLYSPTGVIAGPGGNIYITERAGARVGMLTPDGKLSAFAGNGVSGSRGDAAAPATQEPLFQPNATVFTPDGTAYITDNQVIHKVDPAGQLSTFASMFAITEGNCAGGNRPLRFPRRIARGPDGSLYLSSFVEDRVCRLTPDGRLIAVAGTGEPGFSGDGGPGANAQLSNPEGVAVDAAGVVYIADAGNNRIRRVATDGTITTFVGGGNQVPGNAIPALETRLNGPYGVAIDPQGTVYIANTFAGSVLRVSEGLVTAVAGGTFGFGGDGGPALQARLNQPEEIAFAQGSIYIADSGNHRIRKVDAAGNISTVAGNGNLSGDGGPAGNATLFGPYDVALDEQNNLFLAEASGHRIRKVSGDGTITTVAGVSIPAFSGDGGPAAFASLSTPRSLDLDAAGKLYVFDSNNYKIREIGLDQIIRTIAGNAFGYGGDGGPAASATFRNGYAMAVDRRDGSIYVADSFNYRIRRIAPNGTINTVAGNGVNGFSGDGGKATDAQISFVAGVVVDDDGNLFFSDTNNHRIRKVTPDGMIQTVVGSNASGYAGDGGPATAASLSFPYGVDVGADGTIYIADNGNDRIRRVGTDGIIRTIAGSGATSLAGDGGPALLAGIYSPRGLVADDDGNVYFADEGSHRIRKLTPGAAGTGEISLLNAAGFTEGDIAPGMIVSIFGANLAAGLLTPNSADLPQTLGETTVEVIDDLGVSRFAGLYFVSAGQINCVIPSGTSIGQATVIVRRNGIAVATDEVRVVAARPALFSANANGMGVAAANLLRVSADGTQTIEPIARFDAAAGRSVAEPIDFGAATDQIYLLLYGTGIRGFGNIANVTVTVGGTPQPVLGAAAQSQFAGLDQVNVGPLSRSLAGRGSVNIGLTVSGVAANAVTVDFR